MRQPIVRGVLPPHPVKSRDKVARLRAAYASGENVPPVVVLRHFGRDWAVSGSHRLAALSRERPWEPVVTGRYFLVIDGEALEYEAHLSGHGELSMLLFQLFDGELGEERGGYHRLADLLAQQDDEEVRAALAGQGRKVGRDKR